MRAKALLSLIAVGGNFARLLSILAQPSMEAKLKLHKVPVFSQGRWLVVFNTREVLRRLCKALKTSNYPSSHKHKITPFCIGTPLKAFKNIWLRGFVLFYQETKLWRNIFSLFQSILNFALTKVVLTFFLFWWSRWSNKMNPDAVM